MKLAALLWIASLLPQPAAAQTCLATTVYLEARNQPTLGQYAVAEVALRRRDTGRWGTDLCAVVMAPAQFAPTITPGDYHIDDLRAWSKAWKVAAKSIANWKLPRAERRLVVPEADHFATLAVTTPWTMGGAQYTIGNHAFYALN